MTKLLEQAFTQASKFSEVEQNLLAKWILSEIDSEQRWNSTFARSEALLSQLADEALAEHKAGKTKRLVKGRHIGMPLRNPKM